MCRKTKADISIFDKGIYFLVLQMERVDQERSNNCFDQIQIFFSMPDSATQFNADWKSIKINLTCCHIHPFMSRNFSVMVDQGSNLQQDPTCTKSYKCVFNLQLFINCTYYTDNALRSANKVFELWNRQQQTKKRKQNWKNSGDIDARFYCYAYPILSIYNPLKLFKFKKS